VHNVDNLTIITEINGREADSWNTGDLQRNAAELLSALSEFATLNPGDAILIGTLTLASRCSPAIACGSRRRFPGAGKPGCCRRRAGMKQARIEWQGVRYDAGR
jgi:5-oxopent-3-ene-1,2,5-tricarboxylate decarboxylase/2-hydroxyhepta-2,4-diene-1,7-dioate isomerase